MDEDIADDEIDSETNYILANPFPVGMLAGGINHHDFAISANLIPSWPRYNATQFCCQKIKTHTFHEMVVIRIISIK